MYVCMHVYMYMSCMYIRKVRDRKKGGKENPNVRPKMVVPSLPTLLSDSTAQHLSNCRPLLDSIPPNQLQQQSAKYKFALRI